MDRYTEDLEQRNEQLLEELEKAESERDAAISELKVHEEIHYSFLLDVRFENSPSEPYYHYQCPFRDIKVALNDLKRETKQNSLSRAGSLGYCTIHLNKLYRESTSRFFLLAINFNNLQEITKLFVRPLRPLSPLSFSYDDFKLDEVLNFIETNFKFSGDCVYGDLIAEYANLEDLKIYV